MTQRHIKTTSGNSVYLGGWKGKVVRMDEKKTGFRVKTVKILWVDSMHKQAVKAHGRMESTMRQFGEKCAAYLDSWACGHPVTGLNL